MVFAATGVAQAAKDDARDAGREAKEAAKDAGKGTKKTTHQVKKGTKKAANKSAEKAEEGADKVRIEKPVRMQLLPTAHRRRRGPLVFRKQNVRENQIMGESNVKEHGSIWNLFEPIEHPECGGCPKSGRLPQHRHFIAVA